ncbi:hypothetical protein CHCC19466_0082 [Bacillus licheniformis]|nr:hypothetical protein CHCC20342_2428 [Bacillus licheniformis]TWK72260.1 hypothetical protein CHCC20339_3454 [Bacillus licheniformis]TWL10918.1 hypothetical protein CHCC19466_0082 [Bacillus licheniformis]TWL94509.1 hypothetical protein CHCC15291_0047 [Bacillus licheniformis]TWM05840.1 hypothetical protein CHCC15289_1737 [Bacillus licheniformis]
MRYIKERKKLYRIRVEFLFILYPVYRYVLFTFSTACVMFSV